MKNFMYHQSFGMELPMGFAAALAKNMDAMTYFALLPKEKQMEIISGTHRVHSKKEMQVYVDSLTELVH